MKHINGTTVMVETAGELSDILTANDSYTLIYLGADIRLSDRITVNAARQRVVIDGFYPPDETGVRHKLSDRGTNDEGQIYVPTPSAIDITFQSVDIIGYNYFGILRVQDLQTTENVSVTFRNATYVGPQLLWHVWGSTSILDCGITIQRATSAAHEVGEVNRLRIGGKTTIRHGSTDHPVFYMYKGNASLTILDGAEVEITTEYTFLRREASIPVTIGKGAQLTLTTKQAFAYTTGAWISDLLVDEDAVFKYYRTTSAGASRAIYINGSFTVNRGATVYMQGNYTDGGALLRFTSSSAKLILNDPKSFVLYKPGTADAARAMSFSTGIEYSFSGGQINFWTAATPFPAAGTFADPAPDRWHRPDWSSFNVSGTASDTVTTISGRTISDEDLNKLPTPISNMKLRDARVFSVGNLPLSLGPIVDDGRPITGTTEAGAALEAVQHSGGASYPHIGEAGPEGGFAFPPAVSLTIGDTVEVRANTPFLIVAVTGICTGPGELRLGRVPEEIAFDLTPVAVSPAVLLKRRPLPSGEEDPVIVNDTRADRVDWELWARITGPLQTADGRYVLEDAVVFELEDGTLKTLTEEFTFVCRRACAQYPIQDTSVTWIETQGPLARVTGTLWSGETYSTNVVWEVRPVTSEGE